MKKLIITFSCINICLNLFSQNYIAKYQDLSFSSFGAGTLTFNANSWRYDISSDISISASSADLSEAEINELTAEIKSNKEKIEDFKYTSLSDYCVFESPMIIDGVIKSDLIKPEWNVVADSAKAVGNYQCIMATINLCGYEITAWFAPEIPTISGPWRLWGLPGLIVEAKSTDGAINIELISFEKTLYPPKKPIVITTMTKKECIVLLEKTMKKMQRQLQGTFSDENTDISVTYSKPADKCLLE
ncbi:MAG: GLPGLI family protein [Prevotellaceae bacterium]|jgi:GLPGLI family protein|nr:GLPGLI family protein [Prevotellaceae bacterium]